MNKNIKCPTRNDSDWEKEMEKVAKVKEKESTEGKSRQKRAKARWTDGYGWVKRRDKALKSRIQNADKIMHSG